MKDYRLKFSDETAWWSIADSFGWVEYEYEPQEEKVSEPGQELPPKVVKRKWMSATTNYDFDVIGAVFKPTGQTVTAPDGLFQYPEMAAVDGFHVNVRVRVGNLPDALRQNIIKPSNPVRTFAGGWFEGE
jgi:hypothetical protein